MSVSRIIPKQGSKRMTASSLPMVEDQSIDFAFSFDSLVHVESDVLMGYLAELARTLKPEGVAFLHHSNYGSYRRSTHAFAPLQATLDRLPGVAHAALMRTGVYRGGRWRAASVWPPISQSSAKRQDCAASAKSW